MATNISLARDDELIKVVSAGSYEIKEQTVDNGETWVIMFMCGNSVYRNDVKCEIRYGTDESYEILFVTHGDFSMDTYKELVGDGTKKIKILLQNDSSNSETLHACYRAKKKV